MHALLGPAKILFPLANPDACTPTGLWKLGHKAAGISSVFIDYRSSGGELSCPLAVDTELVYTAILTCPSYTPGVRQMRSYSHWRLCVFLFQGVSLIVEWELQDQNNNDIWCFEVSAVMPANAAVGTNAKYYRSLLRPRAESLFPRD